MVDVKQEPILPSRFVLLKVGRARGQTWAEWLGWSVKEKKNRAYFHPEEDEGLPSFTSRRAARRWQFCFMTNVWGFKIWFSSSLEEKKKPLLPKGLWEIKLCQNMLGFFLYWKSQFFAQCLWETTQSTFQHDQCLFCLNKTRLGQGAGEDAKVFCWTLSIQLYPSWREGDELEQKKRKPRTVPLWYLEERKDC